MKRSKAVSLLGLLLVLWGCEQPSASGPALERLVVTRSVVFGSEEGPGALSGVFDVDVAPDGRVFASEPSFARVVVFARDGTFEATIGRRGDGPGEFQVPGNLSWVGDTLAVLDFQHGISLMGLDGEFFTRVSFRLQGESIRFPAGPIFLLADGSVASFAPAVAGDVLSGQITQETWLKVSRDGVVLDTLAVRPLTGEFYSVRLSSDRGGSGAHPFKSGVILAIPPDGSSVLLVDQSASEQDSERTFSMTRVDLDGDTLQRSLVPFGPIELTSSVIDSVARGMARRWAENEQAVARVAGEVRDQIAWPEFYPPVATALTGSDGSVWVKRHPVVGDSARWDVFDEELRGIGVAYLPASLELKVVSHTAVYGVELDEFDVPWIVRFDISLPRSRPDA